MKKQILSDNKKKLMWRNASIRKTFRQLIESKSSKMAAYEYLAKKYDFHVDNATETFQAVMPRADERTLLNISATTPCILLERFSYEDECLIEYTKSIVRGDKYSFSVSF